MILPDLPSDHPKATIYNSSAEAKTNDPLYAEDIKLGLLENIYHWQQTQYETLMDNLQTVPSGWKDKIPFMDHIMESTPIQALKAETEKLLWHQRLGLGHSHDEYLMMAHKFIDGVSQFSSRSNILDNCPTCIRSKMSKSTQPKGTTKKATQPHQGLSIEFAFSGVKSKNKSLQKDFVGFSGETSWCLIDDQFTGQNYGIWEQTKASLIAWFTDFLHCYSPKCGGKYMYMDQGGELWCNPKVQKLFEKFGYKCFPVGSDASHQNGPVERAHRYISDGIHSLLFGANLDIKFWPFAFHHYLRLKNSLPKCGQLKSPYRLATGRKDNFSGFKTFGCQVWAQELGQRKGRFKSNANKGIFLGFLPDTTQIAMYYDVNTQEVKYVTHLRYDEGMNDLPIEEIPPNVQYLQRKEDDNPIPPEKDFQNTADLHFFVEPFSILDIHHFKNICPDHPTLGFTLSTDIISNRAYISDLESPFIESLSKTSRSKVKGAYIIRIDDSPIFTKEQAESAFHQLRQQNVSYFDLVLAPEQRIDHRKLRTLLKDYNFFAKNQFDNTTSDEPDKSTQTDDQSDSNSTAVINHLRPQYSPSPIDLSEHVLTLNKDSLRAITTILPGYDVSEDEIPSEEIDMAIQALTSTAITPEERALGTFTRRKLKKLDTWDKWHKGELQQLDNFENLKMYSKPMYAPKDSIIIDLVNVAMVLNVLHLAYMHLHKHNPPA